MHIKAHWSEVEKQVQAGETFVVLNRGKPSVRIVPAGPTLVLKWDNHLETALKPNGKSGEETVLEGRENRW